MKVLFYGDVHTRGGPMLPVIAQALHEAYLIGERHQVAAAVCVGDLFDSPQLAMGREASAGDVIRAVTEPIIASETILKTIMIPGNHDLAGVNHLSALSAIADVPGVIVHERPAVIPIRHGDETAWLALLPWVWKSHLLARAEYRGMSAAEFDEAAAGLRRTLLTGFAAEWAGERGHKILALHAEIDGSRTRYMEIPDGEIFRFSVADLREAQADSIAAGHVHLRQDIDGAPVYIGALVEQNFGESGNPTGVMILDTENGSREYVEVDCRRHHTTDLAGYAELIATGRFREGTDVVKIRDTQAPDTLVAGAVFEKAVDRREAAVRAEGATQDSSLEELLPIWYGQEPRLVPLEDLQAALATAVAASPIPVSDAALGGSIDAIREIHIKNFATHVDTHVVIPSSRDGLIALYGENGAGKTTTIEAICAALWGDYCTYDVTGFSVYDMILRPGDALLEVVLESQGHTYRARRAFRVASAKTKGQECDLFEVVDGRDVPVAGGKSRQAEYNAAVERLFGTRALFLATVFQAQKDVGSLIDAEPSERMEFMRRRVGADRFDGVLQWTRGEAARLTRESEDAQRKAAALVPSDGAEEGLQKQVADQRIAIQAAADAVAARTAEKAQADEEIARLRADQLAREEIARQVEAAARQAHDLANVVQVTLAEVEIDEMALGRMAEVLGQRGRLQALQQELANADRHAERVRAAQAERTAVEQQIAAVEAQIDAEHARAVGLAQQQRADLRAQAQDLGARIEAAVVEARHQVQTRRATLSARATELRGTIQREVAAAANEAERRRAAERATIGRLEAEVASEKRALETSAATLRERRDELQKKVDRLGSVGCRDNPLPCPLIDDAREAPRLLERVLADLRTVEEALADGDVGGDIQAELAQAQQRLAAIADPDEAAIAAEQRAELAEVEMEAAGITDVDPLTIATGLRQQRADVIERGKVIEEPARVSAAAIFSNQMAPLRQTLAAIEVPAANGRSADDIRTDIEAIGDVEQQLGRLAAVRDGLPAKRLRLEQQQVELVALREREQAERARLEAVASVDERIAAVRSRVAEIERQAASLQAEQVGLTKRLGVLEEQLASLRRNVEEAARLSVDAQKALDGARILNALAEFFAPTGVPQLLIDLACPQINDILAGILQQMDEATVVQFTTQRDLKGGGTREGLFIQVTDANSTRDIAFYSGGQQSWLRQIVRQALGIFAVQREGAAHQVFVCDEPTAHVDIGRVPKLLGVVYALARRFRQVWVIDHHPHVLTSIGNRVEFSLVNGRTVVSGADEVAGPAPEIVPEPIPA